MAADALIHFFLNDFNLKYYLLVLGKDWFEDNSEKFKSEFVDFIKRQIINSKNIRN
jgi:hypothetical protein